MEKNDIEKLIKEKEKVKGRYKGQILYFSVAFSILSFFLILSFSKQINYIAIVVLLSLISIIFPIVVAFILCIFVKKEKHLKFINFFLCSDQYVLNFLFLASIYFQFYFKNILIDDLNAAVSFYSISWAIFGIAITLFGVWLSINSAQLMDSKQSDDFSKNHFKYNAIIGSIFTFASMIINLIILLSGVSYFSSGTYSGHSSYYIGLIYVSSYVILNMLTFLFMPTILEMAYNSTRFNKSLLEYFNESIKLIEAAEQINETITLLNKLIDVLKKANEDVNNNK